MRITGLRILFLVFLHPVSRGAETSTTEITVKAPFEMPAIRVPVFPKREPFRILGDKREPVRDVVLEHITVGKAHGAASLYRHAEGIRETGIRIGEVIRSGRK